MKLNWDFLGKGVQNKKPSMDDNGYFLELHIALCIWSVGPLTGLSSACQF